MGGVKGTGKRRLGSEHCWQDGLLSIVPAHSVGGSNVPTAARVKLHTAVTAESTANSTLKSMPSEK